MNRQRPVESLPPFEFLNPNKAWVVQETDNLLQQWRDWLAAAKSFPDSPEYDSNRETEALRHGRDKHNQHEILREKTLVFLRNNFIGFEFIVHNYRDHPHESNISALTQKIPVWIHRLEMLQAGIDYARVPDGFWVEQGKKLVTSIAKSGPEKAAEIATSYLKNPLAIVE
ncbi:MAG TPA: hypothetical protein DD706_16005 [Nitrospiraceae bacterium]|nr:hypothetical protein [Nitrospiraceae bacterium]